jgi:hypothetical protein
MSTSSNSHGVVVAFAKKYRINLIIYAVCVTTMLVAVAVTYFAAIGTYTEKTETGTLKYSSGNARVEGVLTLNGKALYCRRSLFFGSTQCLTGAPMVQATVTIMSVPTIFGQQDVPSLIKDERGTFFSLTRGQVVQSWLRLSVLHAVLLSFVPSVILPILFARKQR